MIIDQKLMDSLSQQAKANPRLRQAFDLRTTPEDQSQRILNAVELCKDGQHGIPVPDYVDENVSTKVVKIIQSYVGIVNKMVWRKFWCSENNAELAQVLTRREQKETWVKF